MSAAPLRDQRIAFVVHRYGAEIGGGSEKHCRDFAQRLAERNQVTVLTSCARDYVSWANHFPPGESPDGAVRVLRFPVARVRDLAAFGEQSRLVFTGRASLEDEQRWFTLNGPEMPTLLDYLRQHGSEYDLFVFFSYRYYQSYFGLPLVRERAVLVPTAEEDPAVRLRCLRELFTLPRAIVYNTPEEREMLRRIAGEGLPAGEIAGSGIDLPPDELASEANAARLLAEAGLEGPFFLYLGRVDPNKGCDRMFRLYLRYLQETGRCVPLVLAGVEAMSVPAHPAIRSLGFVADELREALLYRCQALLMPSPYESLSLVVLEAWNHRRPVFVNGQCKVLRGQTERANGGLYYRHTLEFIEGLEYLLANPEQAAAFGAQGREYVDREYRWPTVMARVEATLRQVVGVRS